MPVAKFTVYILPLGESSWSTLPTLQIRPETPATFDFSTYFTQGATPVTFGVQFAPNADGSGLLTGGFENLQSSITGTVLTLNASRVSAAGTIYFRLTAREETGGQQLVPNVDSGWTELSILQRTSTTWDNIPALTMFEGLVYSINFGTYLNLGTPPPVSYTAALAMDISGAALTNTILQALTASVNIANTTLTIDATAAVIAGNAVDLPFYVRFTAIDSNNVSIHSAWTQITLLNARDAAWNNLNAQQLYEGEMLTYNFTSAFVDGNPMVPDFSVFLAADTSGTAITDSELAGLAATVNDSTKVVTFDADSLSSLTADKTVYFRIRAIQPDPMNP